MNWLDYQIRFEADARGQGKSSEFIRKCLSYAEPLVRAGLPVLYDVGHLALEVGLDEKRLGEIISNPDHYYMQYAVPKRAGGYRHISEPVGPLIAVQRWILRNILAQRPLSAVVTAFARGRSIKNNAQFHVNQRMVLSLDVVNFFSSIERSHVFGVFRDLGFTLEVTDALTGLTVIGKGLPQGAPTSPAISNLVMRAADDAITQFAEAHSINYSRYADDLTFSGTFRVKRVIDKVTAILQGLGLKLNSHKTRLMLPHERQEVTGVTVNKFLQASRKLRRSLRKEIYYITKYGPDEHFSRNFSFYRKRLEHLRGIAEFILFLNPTDRDAISAVRALGRVRFQNVEELEYILVVPRRGEE